LPPNTLRLAGIKASNPSSITIGGRAGKLVDDVLVFERAVDDKGNFTLDTQAWVVVDKPDWAGPGVWEADMELALQEVKLKAGGNVPWRTVTFTAVHPGVLPDLGDYLDDLGASSAGQSDAKFDFNFGVPDSVVLPAGDWKVKWLSGDSSVPDKEGTFTVKYGGNPVLTVP
jgi:hypothetical protein